MILFDTARKVNRHLKRLKKERSGRHLSLSRRIERVAPIKGQKLVAMTFDDGPCAAAPEPNKINATSGLTEAILDILKEYSAKGTFDIIGTTEYNYPDIAGKLHGFNWGGTKYDHYPDYGNDKLGGAVKHKDIVARMVREGHELANHTYKHILFGPMKLVYGKRQHYHSLEEVAWDLSQLHSFIRDNFNYDMKLSRPPHYIDKIEGGYSSYDAYSILGYNYLAASFDGGGWKPSVGDYNLDVADMVTPLAKALKEDSDALNCQIIFQKDGYNMSHQTPVVDALSKQLRLLRDYGYTVVTASELISMSPYEDINSDDPCFEVARALEKTGFCVAYRDNTFKPGSFITQGELAMMITPPKIIRAHQCSLAGLTGYCSEVSNEVFQHDYKDIGPKQPYYAAIAYSGRYIVPVSHSFNANKLVDARVFEGFLSRVGAGIKLRWRSNSSGPLRRRDVSEVILSYIRQKHLG